MIYSVQNVTSLGLLGSYSNTLLYNLWDIETKESTQEGAAIMASYIANPLLSLCYRRFLLAPSSNKL